MRPSMLLVLLMIAVSLLPLQAETPRNWRIDLNGDGVEERVNLVPDREGEWGQYYQLLTQVRVLYGAGKLDCQNTIRNSRCR